MNYLPPSHYMHWIVPFIVGTVVGITWGLAFDFFFKNRSKTKKYWAVYWIGVGLISLAATCLLNTYFNWK